MVCLIKGCGAGFVSGLAYKLFATRNIKSGRVIGAYSAAVVCPVVNTGIFLLAMFTIFREQLISIAGGTNTVYFAFVVLAGVNFIVELAVNVVLAPVIVGIMNAVRVIIIFLNPH